MADDSHLSPATCYNVTMPKQDNYNDFFELGQQKINFSFFELSIPDDDPVYTLKKVMYAVVNYANMRGVRAVDLMVELCERDLAFIWLTNGQKPKRDAFYDFKNKKLTGEIYRVKKGL